MLLTSILNMDEQNVYWIFYVETHLMHGISIEWNEGIVLSESKRITIMRLAGSFGLTNPVIVFALIALSISYSPWFSWTENALSDLGVRGIAAILFNSGLIIGGVLAITFAIGLREILPRRLLARAGVLLLILAAAALCAIGLFPETAGSIHFYASVSFFTLFPISLFLIGAVMIQHPSMKSLGVLAVLAGSTAAAVWALSWTSAAIPEALSSLAVSVWSMASGAGLLREASQLRRPCSQSR